MTIKLLRIRKTKTASGSTSVQIVYYRDRKVIVEKHIGSGKTEEAIGTLILKAQHWIESRSTQQELFALKTPLELSPQNLRLIGVTHQFTYQLLECIAVKCGMTMPKDRFLFDFSIMRLIEPTSKLRAITLLSRYFSIDYSERTVYRKMGTIIQDKKRIEAIAVQCAKNLLQDDLSMVLYDVTTLYFETFKSDELRKEGFSKDNKPQQPQIVIGLLVTREGFPLGYEVFAGNTFEGKTMLNVLQSFIKQHGVNKPIVVADAAMLSHKNIEELQRQELFYIVGARLGNTAGAIIKEAVTKLRQQDGSSTRVKTTSGDLIVEFSGKRYRKDKYEMEKLVERAKQIVENKLAVKNVKFIKHKSKSKDYKLNDELIDKAKLLLGMKGYYTNVSETVFSDKEIIDRYHDLWHVEHSFRIAKSDLASRPIFHYSEQAIASHILICFTALMIAKYLESLTKLSLRQIIDAIWQIKEVLLLNTLTDTSFTIRSDFSLLAKDILRKIDPNLSY